MEELPKEGASPPKGLPSGVRLPVWEGSRSGTARPEARRYPDLGPPLYEDLRRGGYRRLVLVVPGGLVRRAQEMAHTLSRETGADVISLTRSCFGACDLPSPEEAPGAQAIVTLGHAPIPNMRLDRPTYFVEMRSNEGDPLRLAEAVSKAGLPSNLGLVYAIQHQNLVAPLVEALREKGIQARLGGGDRRLAYPGQALGCNYTSAESIRGEVEGFLFLGTGLFHPLGLALAVDKPVWALDPLREEIEPPIDREAMIRRRLLTIAQAQDARTWGILVSSFAGQNRWAMAERLADRANRHGREPQILVFRRLDPRDLLGRNLDAYVCTACPRIALDDGALYDRPMLTPPEFLSALGERPLLPYTFDTYH